MARARGLCLLLLLPYFGCFLQPTRHLRVRRRAENLSGFTLLETLGAGAFGTTYRAVCNQSQLEVEEGQEVALKLIKFQDGWKTLDRFEREASVLQRLRHPCIPRFYGSLVRDGPGGRDLGLVSDLVRGASLEELVAQGRWRATPEKLRQLAESLLEVCVHLASFAPPVVHRDIKPANVLLETDSEELKVYLIDFGSAVLGSGTKTAAGTFGYMAPESFANSFTPKSDLYGLGATLLFAATGLEPGTLPTDRLRVKFEKALVGTVWERQETWLPALLRRLLAPAPEDRFSSAAEALQALRAPREALEPSAIGAAVAPLEAPRGSKVLVKQESDELKILFPPPGVNPEQGAFTVAWVTFTAFWTGGVLSAGAPFMALFSLPFWNAGYTMVKDSFLPYIRGAIELRIARDRWTISKSNGKILDEGKTAKLQCDVSGPEMGQSYLVLTEGIETPLKQGGLTQKEAEWLEGLISDYISGS